MTWTLRELDFFCKLCIMKKVKPDVTLQKFKEELVGIVQKSQDIFEKQLSYISAGALALSIGFVKDIVHDFPNSKLKWTLAIGWILLGITLLLNCVSHLVGFYLNNKTISEINTENSDAYDPVLADKRSGFIFKINIWSVTIMILGIGCIIFYVIKNTI